jgi:UDP-2-acetamido-2-deoxy-ribo-hexuluronate aminotransferase
MHNANMCVAQSAPVPFVDLKAQYQLLKREIDTRIQRVLDHGQFILGPEVQELEARLSSYVGVKHALTCASGTDALLMSLMALGIGPGDEVIVPTFTFIATAEVVVLVGATPVFADVDRATCNIDVECVRRAITSRTRAVIPVSLYGQVPDMYEINELASEHGLAVIEDGAQSFGATYRGRRSCGLSLVGCTSFFPSKPLGCYGDGGAVFTDDDVLAQAMREIRVHGQSRRYRHTRIGIGGRMDTLQCAIVLPKLDVFEAEVGERMRIGARYTEAFGQDGTCVRPVELREDRASVYGQYTVLVENRDHVQRELEKSGIPTAVHYPTPIHRQPAYASWGATIDCPIADWLSDRVLSLPMHAYMDEEVQQRVVEAVLRAAA